MKRQERIERIRSVEREYLAAISAVQLLQNQLRADPSWGAARGWRARDGENLLAHLEATFLIRLYAEFEAGLREVWSKFYRRRTNPPMKDLLIALASQRIPQDWLDDADKVRLYRNAVVHEGSDEGAARLSVEVARSRLCRYFSRLPEDW
jgi:hypothetical protein